MSAAPEEDIQTSLLWFARHVLGFTKENQRELYDWQEAVVEPFDQANQKLIQVSLCSPNGAGKSSVIIPVLVLGWLFFYPKGRVILTTADGKQLENQVMPAIESFRHKFPSWKFIERRVETPTGGFFHAFTTNDSGRVEGAHKLDDLDGPLLAIVDEAKSVDDQIFMGIDRWTYNGILLTSSPGKMSGRFFASQQPEAKDYIKIRVGLKDCPNIGQDKIDRIIAVHGPNSPFTRSALHGEFIEIFDGEPVYYAYNAEAHEFPSLPWPQGALLIVGMDGATHNASLISSAKYDKKGNLHIWAQREIVLFGSDTDRQCIDLLKVLANEFPFWNSQSELCPQTLFYCDPALRNSNYTKRGPTSSALKVIQSHGIFPGFKIGLGLQPSFATVNRLLQQNHAIKTAEGQFKTVHHFRINTVKCPTLTTALRGKYRYAVRGQPGEGSEMPLKGELCDFVDDICDAFRYSVANVLDIAPEDHIPSMKSRYPEVGNIEPSRTI